MKPVDEDEGCREVVLNLNKRLNEEKEGRDSKNKRLRICEPVNQGFVVSEEIGGVMEARIENGLLGSGEEMNLNAEITSCSGGLSLTADQTTVFDLNAGIWGMDFGQSDAVANEKTVEIINIPSDESEDEDSKTIDGKEVHGRSQQIEKEDNDECMRNFDIGLGLTERRSFGTSSPVNDQGPFTREEKGKAKVSDSWLSLSLNDEDISIFGNSAPRLEREQIIEDFDVQMVEEEAQMEESFGISSSMNCERRYTREEKGKAKVSDSWLSLSLIGEDNSIIRYPALRTEQEQKVEDSSIFRYPALRIEQNQRVEEFDVHVADDDDEDTPDSLNGEEQYDDFPNRDELEGDHNESYYSRRARELRQQQRRETAIRFARSEGCSETPCNKEKTPIEPDELLGESPGPFSAALKMVREQNTKSQEQLIKWEPSRKVFNGSRLSLLDLSLKVLSQHAEAIVSLELVPDNLRHKLIDMLCDLRRMNVVTLELLIKGSPTEIRLKDSSWLTEEQFLKTFGNFDARKLMVFQLDLCGQCNLDYIMSKVFNTLPKLCIISLKGACRLSDNGLKELLASAPSLQSINLSQCSLLTHDGINMLATSLGSLLKELYIDECLKVDAMLVLPALKKFEHLEVLSVAGIQTLSDQFVRDLMATCGQTIKELDLANCLGLTNYSLKVIGNGSTNLRSLNISNLEKLTDLGLQFLADGCRSIETLKLCRNNFSDEAVAAFLETSGEHLKDLSLNNITLVGPCTAISLAKCSRKLLRLDLSWCRKINNEAMGLIVDSCLSLKLVKLFGCTQITDIFLNGHSNPQVQIVGLKWSPILETTNILEHYGVLLRYSPLANP